MKSYLKYLKIGGDNFEASDISIKLEVNLSDKCSNYGDT